MLLLLFRSLGLFSQTPFGKTYHFGYYDGAGSIIETEEGDILMLGSTSPTKDLSDEDFLLIKTDETGNEVWMKTYGGTEREESSGLIETRDGGFLLLGYTRSFGSGGEDIYLVKTDRNGRQLWQKTFGGTGNDRGTAMIMNRAGGYVFTGYTHTATGYQDLIIYSVDGQGNLLWQRSYGGLDADWGADIIQCYDGGFLVCGTTLSTGQGKSDIYLIKTSAVGNLEWTRIYGGADYDEGMAVQQTYTGEYIVSGYSRSFGTAGYGTYLLKLNASGDTLWTRFYRGMAPDLNIHDDGASISLGYSEIYNPDNGSKGYSPYLFKVSPNGDSLWSASFNSFGKGFGYSFCRSRDGAYLLTGRSSPKDFTQNKSDDVLLIKTYVPTDPAMKERLSYGLFPNPNRGSFTVYTSAPLRSIEVFDSRGRLVFTQKQAPSNFQPNTTVDLPSFQPGIYYARIYSHSGYRSEAFVLY